jgi:predicted transcriptional regulator
MAASHPIMTRVSAQTKAKLRAIAKQSERSEAYLARAAIEQFVEVNDWQIQLVEQRMAEYQAGADVVPNSEVKRWLDAKLAGKKAPMPRGRRP